MIVEVAAHQTLKEKATTLKQMLALKFQSFLRMLKEVNTPQGVKKVKIPGVKLGTKIRLKGLGFNNLKTKTPGDLFAVISLLQRPDCRAKRTYREIGKQLTVTIQFQ